MCPSSNSYLHSTVRTTSRRRCSGRSTVDTPKSTVPVTKSGIAEGDNSDMARAKRMKDLVEGLEERGILTTAKKSGLGAERLNPDYDENTLWMLTRFMMERGVTVESKFCSNRLEADRVVGLRTSDKQHNSAVPTGVSILSKNCLLSCFTRFREMRHWDHTTWQGPQPGFRSSSGTNVS